VSKRATQWFEDLFTTNPDPWGFDSTWYEQRKRALLGACLPRQQYGRAFEPGCAFGHLTEVLASRCDTLLAGDGAPSAVERARARIAALPDDVKAGVSVEVLDLPDDWPAGPFDLIVVSELGYFFDPDDFEGLLDLMLGSLAPGGDLLAVHYRLNPDDAQTGDQVHAAVRRRDGLERLVEHVEAEFLLDVWRRP
jgi:SAM-dependent methyltransferase